MPTPVEAAQAVAVLVAAACLARGSVELARAWLGLERRAEALRARRAQGPARATRGR